MPILVIHGPQGCGKTHHAEKFLRRYECATLVEEWDGCAALPPDALALTNTPPPYTTSAEVLEFEVAMLGLDLADIAR